MRADQKGGAAAKTASGRSSRRRLCLTARRPILAIAVLDRSWRGRYPSQRPPSRRKRTSPPRKLGGGCRRGGRVAEGGGLLNRKRLYQHVSLSAGAVRHRLCFSELGKGAAPLGNSRPVLSRSVAIPVANWLPIPEYAPTPADPGPLAPSSARRPPALLLRRASESRPPRRGLTTLIGKDGEIVGRIAMVGAGSAGTSWMRSVASQREGLRSHSRGRHVVQRPAYPLGRGILLKGEDCSLNQSPVAAFSVLLMWSLP